MTNTLYTQPLATAITGKQAPLGLYAFDLTPEGLADAPAHQEDSGSIVHTGNS